MGQHNAHDPGQWVDFGYVDEAAFTQPPAEPSANEPAFSAQPLDGYTVIAEEFVIDDKAMADWYAANPSLGHRVTTAYIDAHHEQHPGEPSLTRMLSDGVRRGGGRGAQAGRIILDEVRHSNGERVDVDEFERFLGADLGFELTEWQEEVWRRAFGTDQPLRVIGAFDGNVYVGPPSEWYAEQFLSAAIWDEVARTPRADAEMLNRVIDDLATDVTAKIDRTECPKFPRAE